MADGLSNRKMSIEKGAEPVIENPRLPEMTDKARAPRRIGGKVLTMPDEPKPSTGKSNRMKPAPKKRPKTPRPKEFPEQVEAKTPRRPPGAEGYVRIRVRVERGELSVRGLKEVDGPLVAHEELHGDLAYEVSVGGKRVSSGAVPDVGTMRSFPHPDPAPGQLGHHISEAASYQFLVRVPRESVSLASLPRMTVALYRIKQGPLPKHEGPEPLAQRYETELREVGRIQGIRLDRLPKAVQAEARRTLK